MGASSSAISRMLSSGFLHRMHMGVYGVTGVPLTTHGRMVAALLAYCPRSRITHESAPVALGIVRNLGGKVHVTLPTTRRSRRGIVAHAARLHPADLLDWNGLRTTRLPRTLLDIAATDTRSVLPVVLRNAAMKGWLDHDAIERVLRRSGGHHGVRRLRAALDARDPNRGLMRSQLELATTVFLLEYGFPPAERNVVVNLGGDDYTEVDFIWPWAMCALEMDSRAYHDHDERFVEDRRISRRLQAAGWSTPRATAADLGDRRARDAFARDLWRIFERAIARWWL